jgi:2',3'-cyclic-nucleotide 2'-phosphodiesterase
MPNNTLRILLLGDISGAPGRAIFQKHIAYLRKMLEIDAVIVNGENSAGDGRGITSRIMHFFKHNGVNVVTSGNHIWAKKDIIPYLQQGNTDLLRPANFPSSCPGTGVTTFTVHGHTIGVINLQGRVFMREHVGCPFRMADTLLTYLKSKTNIIVVDFHAETTSEKVALAHYLDGQISALVGTHTHVPTADARILPGGTAYITDLGMAGPLHSVIGVKKELIIRQMLTQMPVKFEIETEGPMVLSGVWVAVDTASGKATHIEHVYIKDNDITLESDYE